MTLAERLAEYVRACFTGIWIESHEHQEALLEIAQLCRRQEWRLATWDVDRGLRLAGRSEQAETETGAGDPLAAIRALNALAADDGSALLVLTNFHRFLNSAEIVQALAHQIAAGKQDRTFVVVLSPVVQIPIELAKLFVVVEHDLPSREQLAEIVRGVATEPGELPDEAVAAVLDSAAGLTRYEAENAFALSLVRHRRIEPRVIVEQKSQMLKKSGLLSLHQGAETFADLGGLEALKAFCLRSLRLEQQRSSSNPSPRHPVAVAARLRKIRLRQKLGQRDGPADARARRGRFVGFARRPVGAKYPPGVANCRRDGPLCDLLRRTRKSAQRRQRPRGLGRLEPAVRHVVDLAQRSRERCLFRRHVERHQPAAARVCPRRAVRRRVHDRPAGTAGAGDDLADVSDQVRPRRAAATSNRYGLDRRRNPLLLSIGGVARRSARGSGQERRAGGHHGRRVGRAAAELGRRAVSVRRQAWGLLPQLDRAGEARAAGEPGPIEQLTSLTACAALRTSLIEPFVTRGPADGKQLSSVFRSDQANHD